MSAKHTVQQLSLKMQCFHWGSTVSCITNALDTLPQTLSGHLISRGIKFCYPLHSRYHTTNWLSVVKFLKEIQFCIYIYSETSIYCSPIIHFPGSIVKFLWSQGESYFNYGSRIYCFPRSIVSFSDPRWKRWIEVSLYILYIILYYLKFAINLMTVILSCKCYLKLFHSALLVW
jgi:hypothetical protein